MLVVRASVYLAMVGIVFIKLLALCCSGDSSEDRRHAIVGIRFYYVEKYFWASLLFIVVCLLQALLHHSESHNPFSKWFRLWPVVSSDATPCNRYWNPRKWSILFGLYVLNEPCCDLRCFWPVAIGRRRSDLFIVRRATMQVEGNDLFSGTRQYTIKGIQKISFEEFINVSLVLKVQSILRIFGKLLYVANYDSFVGPWRSLYGRMSLVCCDDVGF